MDTTKITNDIAVLKRALKTAATVALKDKIKAKIAKLNKNLADAHIPTPKLATMLLGAKRRAQGYSTKEFNEVIERLAARDEYHFLKGMGKGKIKDDLKREAKKPGWRFKGRTNFKTPSATDIKNRFKTGDVYMETRNNRSDVVKPAKLKGGGAIYNYEGREVEIRPASKTSKKFIVWDLKYNQKFSNEKFDTKDEAISFANLNRMIIAGGKTKTEPTKKGSVVGEIPTQKGDIVSIKNPLADEDPDQLYVVVQDAIEEYGDNDQILCTALGTGMALAPTSAIEKKDLMVIVPATKVKDAFAWYQEQKALYPDRYAKGGTFKQRTISGHTQRIPKAQYERIEAEYNGLKLEHGATINDVVDRQMELSSICRKHNCTVTSYHEAKKKYGLGGTSDSAEDMNAPTLGGTMGSSMRTGGNTDEEEVDLFEDYDSLPPPVLEVIDRYSEKGNTYETLGKMQKELEALGYTFDYGLDAEPYGLKKINNTIDPKEVINSLVITDFVSGKEIIIGGVKLVVSKEDGNFKASLYYLEEGEWLMFNVVSGRNFNGVIKELKTSEKKGAFKSYKNGGNIEYYKELVKADKARLKNSTGGESEFILQNLAYNQKMLNQEKRKQKKTKALLYNVYATKSFNKPVADDKDKKLNKKPLTADEATDLVRKEREKGIWASVKGWIIHDTKKMSTGGGVTCEIFDSKGERAIDPESIEKLTECTENQVQTKTLNTDKGGNYTPERIALHKKIIRHFKNDVVCITKGRPIAVLMGGAPASGKSTFLKKYRPYLLSDSIFKVDADEIRAELPEYKGWNATQTHEETGDIVNTLISNRTIGVPCLFDFIYDGTMTNYKKYDALITMLKGLGYDIYIVFISNIPKETLVKRALGRYKTSGRFVPIRVIDDFLERGEKSMEQLKRSVNGYIVVDGSSDNYKILERGGKKLPNDRLYEKLGDKIKLEKGGNAGTGWKHKKK